MKFELNKKYFIKSIDLLIELEGYTCKVQRTRQSFSQEDEYRVKINGYVALVTESFLFYILNLKEKEEEKIEEPKVEVKEEEEEEEEEEKKEIEKPTETAHEENLQKTKKRRKSKRGAPIKQPEVQ